jgi:hypothetical protein
MQLGAFTFLAALTTTISSTQLATTSIVPLITLTATVTSTQASTTSVMPLVSPVTNSFQIYLPLVIRPLHPIGKYGLAPGGYDCGDFTDLPPQWFFFWFNQAHCGNKLDDPQFVDMIWGREYMNTPIHSNIILGFNEPNYCGQANLSPLEAAQLWRQIEEKYPDKYLVSPSPGQDLGSETCYTGPAGPAWLWAMVDEYQKLYGRLPRFDAIGVHYYWVNDNFEPYLTGLHNKSIQHGYDKPIWVTEFGTCGTDEVQWLTNALKFIDSTPWITHVGWYKIRPMAYDPATCSSLLNSDRSLTALGQVYIKYLKLEPSNSD